MVTSSKFKLEYDKSVKELITAATKLESLIQALLGSGDKPDSLQATELTKRLNTIREQIQQLKSNWL